MEPMDLPPLWPWPAQAGGDLITREEEEAWHALASLEALDLAPRPPSPAFDQLPASYQPLSPDLAPQMDILIPLSRKLRPLAALPPDRLVEADLRKVAAMAREVGAIALLAGEARLRLPRGG